MKTVYHMRSCIENTVQLRNAVFFWCELSVIFCKAKHLVKPIVFLGRNSLYLLCVHILDGNWESVWHVEGHQFHTALRRCVADIIVFLAVMLVLTAWKKIRRSIQTKKAQICA